MNVCEVEIKVLDSQIFQLHTIAGPNSGTAVMFSQEKHLQLNQINILITIISIAIILFKKSPFFYFTVISFTLSSLGCSHLT